MSFHLLKFSRYLYTGTIDYNQHNKEVILQCLVAADELGLDKLIEHIQGYLVKNEEYAQGSCRYTSNHLST